jgi:hypothetical protein
MLRVQTTLDHTCVDMHWKDEAGNRTNAKGISELIVRAAKCRLLTQREAWASAAPLLANVARARLF